MTDLTYITHNSLILFKSVWFYICDHCAESRAPKETRLHRPTLVLKWRVKAKVNASLLSYGERKKKKLHFVSLPFSLLRITDLGQNCKLQPRQNPAHHLLMQIKFYWNTARPLSMAAFAPQLHGFY